MYIVANQTDFVLYVGKSKNIKSRWNGHHRHKQLLRRDKNAEQDNFCLKMSPLKRFLGIH
ncbi:GIY-YIG nuclease family protein [Pleurocapsa sp. FMAR1]|uniref:GIY-YIG nuclease family protein n=1 Tax=Pleurocapsa sp. FMAR1 TaxID=3040204 RepID=UPI0039AFF5AE